MLPTASLSLASSPSIFRVFSFFITLQTEMDDPFVFMIKDSQISPSQEQILRDHPFVGNPVKSSGDGVPMTLPETVQDAGEDRVFRDVFIIPPENEKQSYAFDFRPRICHKAVQTDDKSETQGFDDFTRYADAAVCVDLNDDSDLGFSLDELNLVITDRTMVAGCSRGKDGDSLIEISNHETDKFQDLGRELYPEDSIDEPPLKRMKNSEQNPGSKSSQVCSGIEPQNIEDNLQNHEGALVSNQKSPCNFAADPLPQQNIQTREEMPLEVRDKRSDLAGISVEKDLDSGENVGSPVTESKIASSTEECVENIESRGRNGEAEKLACTGKGNKEVNVIAETCEKKVGDGLQKLMIIAERLKDIAKVKNGDENAVSFVFDVLKALTKEASQKKDSLENVSFLELAKSGGFTFPTPRWLTDTNT